MTGAESFDILGLAAELSPRQTVRVVARGEGGSERSFDAIVRIDVAIEVDYYRNGGILPAILRKLAAE